LTITHAGPSNWRTHSHAASASAMLLYESSLPCSCVNVASVPGRIRSRRTPPLVRVLAVAQVLQLDEVAVLLRGELGARAAVVAERRQVVADAPSYCAVRLNAATASAKRVARRQRAAVALQLGERRRRTAPDRSPPRRARKFFAAARTIAGPPMSMFSIASSIVLPAWPTVLLERIEVHHQQVDRRDAVLAPSPRRRCRARRAGRRAPSDAAS
jgi:hypothetical protein